MYRKLLVSVLLSGSLVAGCGARPQTPRPPQAHGSPDEGTEVLAIQEAPVPIARQMAGQTGIIEMRVTDQAFAPNHLASPVDGRVKIHIVNAGTKEHNLVIPRYRVYSRILAPGGENYVEFTADEKGDWPYYSDAPGQEESGLSGILKVE